MVAYPLQRLVIVRGEFELVMLMNMYLILTKTSQCVTMQTLMS